MSDNYKLKYIEEAISNLQMLSHILNCVSFFQYKEMVPIYDRYELKELDNKVIALQNASYTLLEELKNLQIKEWEKL